jgi:hypothetical protein
MRKISDVYPLAGQAVKPGNNVKTKMITLQAFLTYPSLCELQDCSTIDYCARHFNRNDAFVFYFNL